jgi:hypothetical protein
VRGGNSSGFSDDGGDNNDDGLDDYDGDDGLVTMMKRQPKTSKHPKIVKGPTPGHATRGR